ncbi:hypothetical protein HMN09_00253500 [Mycena chlorophos]|uniref:F-box domain-containing protein n=1 Tax=Mycena chlorophos TaxID=658473 RepID=A0A8H6TKE0_MYCCL|nr:hypothetical protein HMN09_00253500 [Mycena chlorophos]
MDLPLELVQTIFSHLLLEPFLTTAGKILYPPAPDLQTLAICAQVCRTFRWAAQRTLLTQMTFRTGAKWLVDTENKAAAIVDASGDYTGLLRRVHVILSAQEIAYQSSGEPAPMEEDGIPLIEDIVQSLFNLQTFTLWGLVFHFPSTELRPPHALVAATKSVRGLVASALSRPSLRRLEISHLTFSQPQELASLLGAASGQLEELVLWDLRFVDDALSESQASDLAVNLPCLKMLEVLGTAAKHSTALFRTTCTKSLVCDRVLPPLFSDSLEELTLFIGSPEILEASIGVDKLPTNHLRLLQIRVECILEGYIGYILRRFLQNLDTSALHIVHVLLNHFTDVDRVWMELDASISLYLPEAKEILIELADDPEWREMNAQEKDAVRFWMKRAEDKEMLDVLHIPMDIHRKELRNTRCRRCMRRW